MSRPQWLTDLYAAQRKAVRDQRDQDEVSDGQLAEDDEYLMLGETHGYAP